MRIWDIMFGQAKGSQSCFRVECRPACPAIFSITWELVVNKSLDWFKGIFNSIGPIFTGKIDGFLKISLKPIHWSSPGWLTWASCATKRGHMGMKLKLHGTTHSLRMFTDLLSPWLMFDDVWTVKEISICGRWWLVIVKQEASSSYTFSSAEKW